MCGDWQEESDSDSASTQAGDDDDALTQADSADDDDWQTAASTLLDLLTKARENCATEHEAWRKAADAAGCLDAGTP